ncbi:site-specific DNA-methyltransferase [Amedibacillus dolichus]|uniref:site-specific DNA-methyltransferase n=1 Tax=Amedibacillus dolichus TaxID=31971 RepID=UPI002943A580|nr:site-specific DNA-methyltransferase [Amedibacillus dolichus]
MANKLELTWYGKEDPIVVEPRILIEDTSLSNCEQDPDTENMIIHGDNLLALKALESKYAGQVKCIYIDPPYNTGEAFEYYDDNLEHSIWLKLMHARLIALRELLSDDGFLCCQIDDSEGHYLKAILDEIFGRSNYLTTIYIRVRYPEKTLKQDMAFHKEIEQVHVYRKSPSAKPKLKTIEVGFEKFKYKIETSAEPIKVLELGGKKVEVYEKGDYSILEEEGSEFGLKEIWASGTILDGNSSGRFFRDYLTGRYEDDGYGVLYKVFGIGDDRYEYRFFTGPNRKGATKGKYFQGVPIGKLESGKMTREVPINGFLDLAANFGNCRHEGGSEFRGGKKPEVLIKTLLSYFSSPGDLVLDSFLGSGTTAAVAHKMGRKYIGVEMGNQAYILCQPRLNRVISGDKTGISSEVHWQGGGGYRFYELAPSLINIDDFGEAIINPDYDADMLAAAMALHEGFTYQPDDKLFWKQSIGNESSYLFVTTRHLNSTFLDSIKDTMEENEYLIVACRSYDAGLDKAYSNITIKKIPQMLLERCEFDKSDYNLNIVHPPVYEDEEDCDE